MLVVEYRSICRTIPHPPPPPNRYEKLHNLDFCTFSKLINWKKLLGNGYRVILTTFDSNHVIPYGRFNDNCVAYIYTLYTVRKFK